MPSGALRCRLRDAAALAPGLGGRDAEATAATSAGSHTSANDLRGAAGERVRHWRRLAWARFVVGRTRASPIRWRPCGSFPRSAWPACAYSSRRRRGSGCGQTPAASRSDGTLGRAGRGRANCRAGAARCAGRAGAGWARRLQMIPYGTVAPSWRGRPAARGAAFLKQAGWCAVFVRPGLEGQRRPEARRMCRTSARGEPSQRDTVSHSRRRVVRAWAGSEGIWFARLPVTRRAAGAGGYGPRFGFSAHGLRARARFVASFADSRAAARASA